MELEAFCRQSNVIVVVGKGGVGKTTVSATIALTAARAGLDVLVTCLDDTAGVAALFGRDPVPEEEEAVVYGPDAAGDHPAATAGGRVRVRLLTPDAALIEYLRGHGLGRVSRHLIRSGALDLVAGAIPGIAEVLVLGKVKQLERAEDADLIVIDAPASGHAVSLLTSSGGLLEASRGGPLRTQAQQVVELLKDPARCQVVLVTLPEETPVNEAMETAYRLEDEVGVALGPIVVNGCYPVYEHLLVDPTEAAREAGVEDLDEDELRCLAAAAKFRVGRQELQAEQLARLGRELPLAQLRLPNLFQTDLGPGELVELADSLSAGVAGL